MDKKSLKHVSPYKMREYKKCIRSKGGLAQLFTLKSRKSFNRKSYCKNKYLKPLKTKSKKHTSTVKSRPSPSESATLFKLGTKKEGNDGNIWEIVKNINGVKRWKKISQKKGGAYKTKTRKSKSKKVSKSKSKKVSSLRDLAAEKEFITTYCKRKFKKSPQKITKCISTIIKNTNAQYKKNTVKRKSKSKRKSVKRKSKSKRKSVKPKSKSKRKSVKRKSKSKRKSVKRKSKSKRKSVKRKSKSKRK